MHLWEVDHSYYCNDGNFLKNGCLGEFDSFADFVGDELEHDFDYNLIFRWDWEVETEEENSDTPNERGSLGYGTLKLYRMQQRKGHFFIQHIKVGPDDEPAVREYLKKAYSHLREIWKPVAGQPEKE